jgi:hypothetical protein
MDWLPDCWLHRRVFADLGLPRDTEPHSVRTHDRVSPASDPAPTLRCLLLTQPWPLVRFACLRAPFQHDLTVAVSLEVLIEPAANQQTIPRHSLST